MSQSTPYRRLNGEIPWLGIVLLIVLAVAFLLPVLPNDFWWYLRLGSDILQSGHIPSIETYSSTVTGQAANYPMWLSGVVLDGLYQAGGLTAVVFMRGLCVAILYAILWYLGVKNGLPGWLSSLLTILCALAGANNWAVRPQMLVYPLFGLALLILSNTFTYGPRKLTWLIPIALLWANLHGSVMILFLLAGPLWLFKYRNRRVFLTLLIMFLATWVNPRGPLLWLDSYNIVFAEGLQFVQEWKPPSNTGWQMNIFFAWVLAFLPILALSPRKLNLVQWSWLIGFGWMAFSGTRFVIWFLCIMLYATCWLLAGWNLPALKPTPRRLMPVNIAFLGLLLGISLSFLPGIRQTWWGAAPENQSANTPVDAVKWLEQHPDLQGTLFNDYIFGSYLIYALPKRPVWIDTRFHQYPHEQWEKYLTITNASPGWQAELAGTNTGILLLDVVNQADLINELTLGEDWCQQYHDETAVIFTRCE